MKVEVVYNFCVVCKGEMKRIGDVCDKCLQQSRLQTALADFHWTNHKIGDKYTMDNKPDLWKIVYYPIFEDGKNGEIYQEPRCLVEKPIPGGTDFREVPLRYLFKPHSRQ